MYRVIAVVACGFALSACASSWMPSFDMSMPSFTGWWWNVAYQAKGSYEAS